MLDDGDADQDNEQHHGHDRGPADGRGPECLGIDAVSDQIGALLRPTAGERVDGIENLRRDRKSTRLNSKSRQYLVCRLLLEKKKPKLAKSPQKDDKLSDFLHGVTVHDNPMAGNRASLTAKVGRCSDTRYMNLDINEYNTPQ